MAYGAAPEPRGGRWGRMRVGRLAVAGVVVSLLALIGVAANVFLAERIVSSAKLSGPGQVCGVWNSDESMCDDPDCCSFQFELHDDTLDASCKLDPMAHVTESCAHYGAAPKSRLGLPAFEHAEVMTVAPASAEVPAPAEVPVPVEMTPLDSPTAPPAPAAAEEAMAEIFTTVTPVAMNAAAATQVADESIPAVPAEDAPVGDLVTPAGAATYIVTTPVATTALLTAAQVHYEEKRLALEAAKRMIAEDEAELETAAAATPAPILPADIVASETPAPAAPADIQFAMPPEAPTAVAPADVQFVMPSAAPAPAAPADVVPSVAVTRVAASETENPTAEAPAAEAPAAEAPAAEAPAAVAPAAEAPAAVAPAAVAPAAVAPAAVAPAPVAPASDSTYAYVNGKWVVSEPTYAYVNGKWVVSEVATTPAAVLAFVNAASAEGVNTAAPDVPVPASVVPADDEFVDIPAPASVVPADDQFVLPTPADDALSETEAPAVEVPVPVAPGSDLTYALINGQWVVATTPESPTVAAPEKAPAPDPTYALINGQWVVTDLATTPEDVLAFVDAKSQVVNESIPEVPAEDAPVGDSATQADEDEIAEEAERAVAAEEAEEDNDGNLADEVTATEEDEYSRCEPGHFNCDWTLEWSCPGQKSGPKSLGQAAQDESDSFFCCCTQGMYVLTLPAETPPNFPMVPDPMPSAVEKEEALTPELAMAEQAPEVSAAGMVAFLLRARAAAPTPAVAQNGTKITTAAAAEVVSIAGVNGSITAVPVEDAPVVNDSVALGGDAEKASAFMANADGDDVMSFGPPRPKTAMETTISDAAAIFWSAPTAAEIAPQSVRTRKDRWRLNKAPDTPVATTTTAVPVEDDYLPEGANDVSILTQFYGKYMPMFANGAKIGGVIRSFKRKSEHAHCMKQIGNTMHPIPCGKNHWREIMYTSMAQQHFLVDGEMVGVVDPREYYVAQQALKKAMERPTKAESAASALDAEEMMMTDTTKERETERRIRMTRAVEESIRRRSKKPKRKIWDLDLVYLSHWFGG